MGEPRHYHKQCQKEEPNKIHDKQDHPNWGYTWRGSFSYKARKLRGSGRGEGLKHEDHAGMAWNMLEQARVVPELVVWLRASILDSDCLAAQ